MAVSLVLFSFISFQLSTYNHIFIRIEVISLNTQSEQVSTIYSDSMPITETNTEELCKYIFTQCFIPVTSSDTDCQDRKYDISE